ncbi:MAG: hypothetical protein GY696_22510 [Gammaproteobacteria bacterium]|nr:hypothetical protein [Gammaproteobacteria bacterium]
MPPVAHGGSSASASHNHHRLIRAVSRMHPRHQRQWIMQQNRQEQMRYQMTMPRAAPATASQSAAIPSSAAAAAAATSTSQQQPHQDDGGAIVIDPVPGPSTASQV